MNRSFSSLLTILLMSVSLLSVVLCLPVDNFAANVKELSQQPTSKDVYYRTEGIISGQPAPKLTAKDYPTLHLPYPFNENRVIIWVLAQQHLYFGSLVLGGFFWIMLLEVASLVTGKRETSLWCGRFAYEILKILVLVFSMAVILGILLLFGLLSLYPDFTKYLVGVFRPFFMIYGLLFLVLSVLVYIYFYSWRQISREFSKWLHASLGLLINLLGTVVMMLANSWSSFMMSPAGVDDQGRFLGNYWHVLHNALWNPLNVHRFFGNIIFSSAVIGAYAAYQAMKVKTDDERGYYDWASHIAFLTGVFALFTVPFGGYWLSREIYAYRQQMGITLLGGLLGWSGIILVILIGLLFFAINYYVWQRIDSIREGKQYSRQIKYAFLVLAACLLVYITPHTLVIKASELQTLVLKAYGVQQHPLIGNFGVESAKQTAINIMMAVTIWSLLMLWQTRYQSVTAASSMGNAVLLGLFLAGGINIIWLGIYGYYIPANVRVGLSIPMVMTALNFIVLGSVLTAARLFRSQQKNPVSWGNLSIRGYFALLFMAVTLTWIMGLQGYVRSAVRLFWHAMEIFHDNSPWAFTHTIGFAGNVITMNVLLFWGTLLIIIWLAKVYSKGT